MSFHCDIESNVDFIKFKAEQIRKISPTQLKKKCTYCEKPLVPIGLARKKGKSHPDWLSRKMHKKCYISYKSERHEGSDEEEEDED